MINESNETVFSNLASWVYGQLQKVIKTNLQNKIYDPLTSQEQISAISTQIIQKLTNTNKNFKYIVSVTIVAKSSNGLDIGGLSYWNPQMDGSTCVKWESKYLSCIGTIYGIAS